MSGELAKRQTYSEVKDGEVTVKKYPNQACLYCVFTPKPVGVSNPPEYLTPSPSGGAHNPRSCSCVKARMLADCKTWNVLIYREWVIWPPGWDGKTPKWGRCMPSGRRSS